MEEASDEEEIQQASLCSSNSSLQTIDAYLY